jgi:hypothetical protein
LHVKGHETEKFRVKVNNNTRKTRSHASDVKSLYATLPVKLQHRILKGDLFGHDLSHKLISSQ